MKKIILTIDGMSCSMCESHINSTIRDNFTIKKVKSNHKTGETEIIADDYFVPNNIEELIDKTGYKVISIKEEPIKKKGLFSFFS